MVARHERQFPNERAIIDRPYGFVLCHFVSANSPINQNLKPPLLAAVFRAKKRGANAPLGTIQITEDQLAGLW